MNGHVCSGRQESCQNCECPLQFVYMSDCKTLIGTTSVAGGAAQVAPSQRAPSARRAARTFPPPPCACAAQRAQRHPPARRPRCHACHGLEAGRGDGPLGSGRASAQHSQRLRRSSDVLQPINPVGWRAPVAVFAQCLRTAFVCQTPGAAPRRSLVRGAAAPQSLGTRSRRCTH